MRLLKWALAASLLFNCLALAGYFYARQAATGADRVAAQLQLDSKARAGLDDLRRAARQELLQSRHQMAPQRDALMQALRAARPGQDELEPALRRLSEARLAGQLTLTRRLVAYRETLPAEQRQAFDRQLGRPGFLLGVLGFQQAASSLRGDHPTVTDSDQP